MMISIPPKYVVSQVVGFIKGKSAIYIARTYLGRKRNYVGHHFWARGYFVSTVGRDEQVIREYIRHQEKKDRRVDQLQLMYKPLLGVQGANRRRLLDRFERFTNKAPGFAGRYLLKTRE